MKSMMWLGLLASSALIATTFVGAPDDVLGQDDQRRAFGLRETTTDFEPVAQPEPEGRLVVTSDSLVASRLDVSDDLRTDVDVGKVDSSSRVLELLRNLEAAYEAADPDQIGLQIEMIRELLEVDQDAAWEILELIRTSDLIVGPARAKVVQLLIMTEGDEFQERMRSAFEEMEVAKNDAPSPGRSAVIDDLRNPSQVHSTLASLPATLLDDEEILAVLEEIVRTSDNDALRRMALDHLGSIESGAHTELFLQLAREESSHEMRIAAVRSLVNSSEMDAGLELLQILENDAEMPAARSFAAQGLGNHPGMEGCTEELVYRFWEDSDANVRTNALFSLVRQSSESAAASEALHRILQDHSNAEFRAIAASGLSRSMTPLESLAVVESLRYVDPSDRVRLVLEHAYVALMNR